MRRRYILAAALSAVVVAGGAVGWNHWHRAESAYAPPVVPVSLSRAVNFPIYYPDPEKLPNGYKLDQNSFSSPVKNGVAYSISYDRGQKMVFSIQAKPSDSELQTFNSSYIPLRIDYQTPVGQAEIGAYHNQTLVSLPVANGPWVVITAPPDINQDQLKQVLNSIKH